MMKTLSRILVVLMLLGIVFMAFGPGWYFTYSPTLKKVEISSTLQDYIQKKESAYSNIKEGNASTLVWAISPGEKTPYALVYLHGFSASPKEISPVVENLAASLKFNAYFPRLSGHGLKDDFMNNLTDDDLFQDAEEAYDIAKKMGDKVIVVGTSTGATLALWLAARHPDISAMALLSPNLGIQDPRGFLAAGPIGYWIARMVVGPIYTWKAHYPKQEDFWTTSYSVNGVRVMTDVVNEVTKIDFSQIQVPSLVIWTPKDTVVDLKKALAYLKQMPSSQNEFIESTSPDHVLAGDITSPSTTKMATEDIEKFLKKTLQLN